MFVLLHVLLMIPRAVTRFAFTTVHTIQSSLEVWNSCEEGHAPRCCALCCYILKHNLWWAICFVTWSLYMSIAHSKQLLTLRDKWTFSSSVLPSTALIQAAAIADSPTLLRPDRAARHKRGMSDVSPSNSSGEPKTVIIISRPTKNLAI